jgi:hypothetical protein
MVFLIDNGVLTHMYTITISSHVLIRLYEGRMISRLYSHKRAMHPHLPITGCKFGHIRKISYLTCMSKWTETLYLCGKNMSLPYNSFDAFKFLCITVGNAKAHIALKGTNRKFSGDLVVNWL